MHEHVWIIIIIIIIAAFDLLYTTTTTTTTTAAAAAERASRNSNRVRGIQQSGLHLPLSRKSTLSAEGLGDFFDVTYNVLIDIGGTSLPVVLDTGSSDLWVLSTSCDGEACAATNDDDDDDDNNNNDDDNNDNDFHTALYPPNSFHGAGVNVTIAYGDSQTGTHATGTVGYDAMSLAGFTLQDQYFAAIDDTNTSVVQSGCSGIFGLGFPLNSVIWADMFLGQRQGRRRETADRDGALVTPSTNFATRWFNKSFLGSLASHRISTTRKSSSSSSSAKNGYRYLPARKRQATSMSGVVSSFEVSGPFIPRLVSLGMLASPMFAIALQRETIDIGGNEGSLFIGGLPSGVRNEDLTWVPVRTYTPQQGGWTPLKDASHEAYPIAWEIPVDDVFFDGVKLERSQLASPNISLSALVDTGNSLIRGPPDVISNIYRILGGNRFSCSVPHTLAFQIGGRLFPVDPRDFVNQARAGDVRVCAANLVKTDVPVLNGGGGGGYLYSWSLGDPFLKGVLAAFYYGSFERPLQDSPRIGFLSTVPSDAGQQLEAAVAAAYEEQDDLPATKEGPPFSLSGPLSTGIGGIALASPVGVAPPPPATATAATATATATVVVGDGSTKEISDGVNHIGQAANGVREGVQASSTAAALWSTVVGVGVWMFWRTFA